jgi:Rrf2 family transcriptional regulator, cysteine metabolism repressor
LSLILNYPEKPEMHITTSGRYGLRVMIDLALNNDGGPVLRHDIAARQAISAEYIAQLVKPLVKAGLVKTVMGPGGGYYLGRKPAQIPVGDIIRALEGPIAAVYCVIPAGALNCERAKTCTAHLLWTRLSTVIEQFLDSVSLEELHQTASQIESGDPAVCTDAVDTFLRSFGGMLPLDCPECDPT